jgi:hypothetical protein
VISKTANNNVRVVRMGKVAVGKKVFDAQTIVPILVRTRRDTPVPPGQPDRGGFLSSRLL